MRFDFQAQRVLITGGTSGIGFAIAQAFADAGAAVTATGLTDALAVAAAGRDSRIQFRALDVRDSAAVTKLVGDFDSLNVLVNCAGMLRAAERSSSKRTFSKCWTRICRERCGYAWRVAHFWRSRTGAS